MKNGWQNLRLEEVCKEITDGSHFSPKTTEVGYPYVTVRDIENDQIDFANCKSISAADYNQLLKNGCQPHKGNVLFSKDGTVGKVALIDCDKEFVVLSSLAIVRPDSERIRPAFLKWVMKSPAFLNEAVGMKTGVALRRIILRNLKSISIPVPPLADQQRIVDLLDEAFAGIATVQANVEKNLQNARALFESYVQSVFTERESGWVEKTIADSFKVRSGDFLPAKAMVGNGSFNVFGGNGITGRHNRNNLSGENIIIGRVGAKCGNVHHLKGDAWVTDNALYISEYLCHFDLGFLTRLLRFKDLRSRANQMAQPVISYTTIKDTSLAFPLSKVEQKKLSSSFDALEVETERLVSLFERKLAALEELKKSLLDQAFTGKL
jgi:type I restriction enzyme S subunit